MELREGEEVLMRVKPIRLAFIDLYFIFFYTLSLGLTFIIYQQIEQIISQTLRQVPLIGLLVKEVSLSTFLIFLTLVLFLPYLMFAVVKITWRWILVPIIIITASIATLFLFKDINYLQLPLITAGVLGLLLTEYYRRGHTYYITNQRIITELRFVSQKRREILYSKIADLVVNKGVLGRLFNYGTIIPITSAGFGLGEDFSAITAEVGYIKSDSFIGAGVTGAKSVKVPRGRSSYILFGIPKVDMISELISTQIHKREEAQYLEKMAKHIEEIYKDQTQRAP